MNEPRSLVIVTAIILFGCSSAREESPDVASAIREVVGTTDVVPAPGPPGPIAVVSTPGRKPADRGPKDVAVPREEVPRLRTPRRGAPEEALRQVRRGTETEPWTLPMPAVERAHPALPFTDPGSISVGTVTAGFLVRGRELPLRGPHHAVLEEHGARGTRWGTDELIEAVLAAAEHVAGTFPDATLGAANIARRGGGRLPWSISHNAGRDMDIGFYLVDGEGRDVVPDTLLQVAPPEGTVTWAGQELHFDVSRNYLLLESLLLSGRISIQYVFCADFLVKRLRAEAARRGAPRRVRKALETFVRQPRGTLPHDDHMHIRIRCSPEDRLEGCRDIVEGHEEVPDERAWQDRVTAVEALLRSDEPRLRRDAAWSLGLLRAVRAVPALEGCLEDPEPAVRRAAFEALANLWRHPPTKTVARVVGSSEDPAVVERGLQLLRRGGRSAREIVRDLLRDSRVLPDLRRFSDGELVVRKEAAVVAGWLADGRLFQPLVDLTADADPRVRRAADWALRLTTNHAVRAADGGPIVDGAALAAAWTAWRKRAGGKRARWLRNGFEVAGLDVARRSRRAARALLGMIVSDESHLAFNAQRLLADWCPGRGPGLGLQDRWWIRRQWKRGLTKCFR